MNFRFGGKFAAFALLTVLWMIVIFLFSSQNADDSSDTSGQVLAFICGFFNYTPSEQTLGILSFCVRKAAHMTEFGLLGVLCLNTIRRGFGNFVYKYPAAFVISSIYAATDEMHQLFVEGRSGQALDWLIDSIGIVIWLSFAWLLNTITNRIRHSRNYEM